MSSVIVVFVPVYTHTVRDNTVNAQWRNARTQHATPNGASYPKVANKQS